MLHSSARRSAGTFTRIGLVSTIGLEARGMNMLNLNDISFTIELGLFGGIPAGSSAFGATLNPEAIYDQASQFEFYEGGSPDIAFVGALDLLPFTPKVSDT